MLTPDQLQTLRDLFEANEELARLGFGDEFMPADDVQAAELATTLMPPQVVTGRLFTELGIIAAFTDPAVGEDALQRLEATAASGPEHALLARMLRWLAPGMPGLDFGNPALRAAITAYAAAGVLSDVQRDTILALGQVPVVVTASDIARCR